MVIFLQSHGNCELMQGLELYLVRRLCAGRLLVWQVQGYSASGCGVSWTAIGRHFWFQILLDSWPKSMLGKPGAKGPTCCLCYSGDIFCSMHSFAARRCKRSNLPEPGETLYYVRHENQHRQPVEPLLNRTETFKLRRNGILHQPQHGCRRRAFPNEGILASPQEYLPCLHGV